MKTGLEPEDLQVVDRLLEDWTPERRCRGAYARGKSGKEVDMYGKAATSFCVMGEIYRVSFDHHIPSGGIALQDALTGQLRTMGVCTEHGPSVMAVNDCRKGTCGPDAVYRAAQQLKASLESNA